MTPEQEEKILKEIKDNRSDGCVMWVIAWILLMILIRLN